ncbi:MAG: hypothetical protein AAF170_17340 [Bacteroidota bacterium]
MSSESSGSPEIESVALAIGLVVLGVWMLLAPGAIEGASTGGRHGMVKMVLAATWGTTGGLVFLGLGLASLGWMFRPGRTPQPPNPNA